MKNLLLAFAFIGFMVTSYATTTTSVSTVMTECDGDDKCDKKDCKHDTKACADHKKSSKKECKKGDAKKSCCSKDAKKDAKKSCHGKETKKEKK